MLKKGLRIFGIAIAAILLVAVCYVGYVLVRYSRIEDRQALEVNLPQEALESEVKIGKTYTVFTQNLGFGAYTPDFTFFMDGGTQSWAESKESVLNCINQGAKTAASYSPDFIFFQEVDVDSTRSYHVDQKALLLQKFQSFASAFAVNYHSSFLMYPFTQPHGASNSGILTLSNVQITSSLRRSLPISTSLSKLVDLDRCYSVTRVPTENGKELVLYNVHLSAYGGSDEIRTAQMTMLFNDMQAEYEAGNYCVCGGDFNHDFTTDSTQVLNGGEQVDFGWAQPFPVDLLTENVKQALDYTSGKQEPTCRNCDVPYEKGNFTIIVDGFLVTDNVTVTRLENLQTDFAYSDHNPVLMQFELK